MVRNASKVLVALSDGVDSSTAAALLVQEGLDCEAVFMITGRQYQNAQAAAQSVTENHGRRS
jgi:tRNA U34 2-thiouridine synthase MnmA/TrmU